MAERHYNYFVVACRVLSVISLIGLFLLIKFHVYFLEIIVAFALFLFTFLVTIIDLFYKLYLDYND